MGGFFQGYEAIDGLKGCAIFMVVYGHAIASFSGLGDGSQTMLAQKGNLLIHMPLFVLLSSNIITIICFFLVCLIKQMPFLSKTVSSPIIEKYAIWK